MAADAWVEQIRSSDRPEDLQNMLIALPDLVASFYGPSREHAAVGFALIPPGSGLATADKIVNSLFDRIGRAKERAANLVRNRSTALLASLSRYVLDKTGYAGDLQAEVAKVNFINRVNQYLTSGVNDLREPANNAVSLWVASRGDIESLRAQMTPLIGRAAAQARMVVRTEMQNAYVDLVRSALASEQMVERVVQPGACDACKSRAGEQIKTDDSFWTHPNCACTFKQVTKSRS